VQKEAGYRDKLSYWEEEEEEEGTKHLKIPPSKAWPHALATATSAHRANATNPQSNAPRKCNQSAEVRASHPVEDIQAAGEVT
jgi:hypothetical protein